MNAIPRWPLTVALVGAAFAAGWMVGDDSGGIRELRLGRDSALASMRHERIRASAAEANAAFWRARARAASMDAEKARMSADRIEQMVDPEAAARLTLLNAPGFEHQEFGWSFEQQTHIRRMLDSPRFSGAGLSWKDALSPERHAQNAAEFQRRVAGIVGTEELRRAARIAANIVETTPKYRLWKSAWAEDDPIACAVWSYCVAQPWNAAAYENVLHYLGESR